MSCDEGDCLRPAVWAVRYRQQSHVLALCHQHTVEAFVEGLLDAGEALGAFLRLDLVAIPSSVPELVQIVHQALGPEDTGGC